MRDSTIGSRALQTERHLGWLVYAEGMPVCVCGSPTMREGWHQANRDEAAALMCEVKPRVIAIGRCENGGEFRMVAPPSDWLSDDEIDAIFSRPARLTDEQVEELESERVGEDFCSNPWNW